MLASVDPHHIHAEIARPLIRKLAKSVGHTVHLGVLEGDMTTYLVKEGRVDDGLLTREDMQLESYCSGIGKVLLAYLSEADRQRYLSGGPFVRLTQNCQRRSKSRPLGGAKSGRVIRVLASAARA
ncbi:IclR family transcriptional regulator C-terminal domain-containing protein [Sphingobium sp. CFD-2]|uniref:IclR family transcriptional regulator domain-containing protein n=1 Tax=Sphingobium sp. CFD-2 TaxID=2878542 RepID=UPI00214B903C|nr:IclR family transcriptional regulator C-terminal domain-containing protein [Sphingobium sp. CFD-2]